MEKSSITNGMYIKVVLILPINMPRKSWRADTTLRQTEKAVWQCETNGFMD